MRPEAETEELWDVWLVDFDGGDPELVEKGLTWRQASIYWRVWEVEETGRVLMPRPSWLNPPIIVCAS